MQVGVQRGRSVWWGQTVLVPAHNTCIENGSTLGLSMEEINDKFAYRHGHSALVWTYLYITYIHTQKRTAACMYKYRHQIYVYKYTDTHTLYSTSSAFVCKSLDTYLPVHIHILSLLRTYVQTDTVTNIPLVFT